LPLTEIQALIGFSGGCFLIGSYIGHTNW
jgi:hypothetical protein